MINKLNVAILPSSNVFFNDDIFEKNKHRDDCLFFFRLLKKVGGGKGFRIHTFDKFSPNEIDVLVFYRLDLNVGRLLHLISLNKNMKLIHVMHEPSTVVPFHRLEIVDRFPFDLQYVLNDDIAEDSKCIKKICYGITPTSKEDIPYVKFDARKFMTTIAGAKTSRSKGELYSERERAILFFSKKPTGFDLYGAGWKKCRNADIAAVYRGFVDNKKDILKNYKYTLCFENTNGFRGYITEKIFDCFSAGTVPIYLGAPNIEDYIPKECFIDFRDFRGYEELYLFLRELPESKYLEYLDAVRLFVETDSYNRVTARGYVDTLMKGLEEAGKLRVNRSSLQLRFTLLVNVFRASIFYVKNFSRMRRYLFELLTP